MLCLFPINIPLSKMSSDCFWKSMRHWYKNGRIRPEKESKTKKTSYKIFISQYSDIANINFRKSFLQMTDNFSRIILSNLIRITPLIAWKLFIIWFLSSSCSQSVYSWRHRISLMTKLVLSDMFKTVGSMFRKYFCF